MIVLYEVEIADGVRQNVRPKGFGEETALIEVPSGGQQQKTRDLLSFNLHFTGQVIERKVEYPLLEGLEREPQITTQFR
jgi:hypothetical protein